MKHKKITLILIMIIVIVATCCCFFACQNTSNIESFYKVFCESDSMRIDYTLSGALYRGGEQNCLSYDDNKIYSKVDGEEVFCEIVGDKLYTYMVFGGEWRKDEGVACVGKARDYFKDLVCQLFNSENFVFDSVNNEYVSKPDISITVLDKQLEQVKIKFDKKTCEVCGVSTMAGAVIDVNINILDLNNVMIILPTVAASPLVL